MDLVQAFASAARRQPNVPAVRTMDASVTWSQLDARTDAAAWALVAEGIQPGDRVAVQSANRIEFVEAVLATTKAGGILVPISHWDGPEQVRYVLEHSEPRLLLFDQASAEVAVAESEAAGIIGIGFDDAMGLPGRTWAERIAAAPQGSCRFPASGHDTFYIGYTSGSTGQPKAVAKSPHSVVDLGIAAGVAWGLRQGWTELITMPMCHGGGLWQLVYDLTLGITAGLAPSPGFDPDLVFTLLDRWQVDWTILVPTMSDLLLAESGGATFPAVKAVTSGSAPMFSATKEGLLELFPHARLSECYGATETGVVTTLQHEDQLRKTRCVGLPIPGVSTRIVGPDGEDVPMGDVGEIAVRSPYTFDSYYKDKRLTQEARTPDGYVRVGDLARQDDEGYFYVVDRKNDLIITGGLNVYPAEVEEVVKSLHSVQDAVVVGTRDDRWGEMVTAVVLSEGDITEKDVIATCAERLPSYKVPKEVRFVNSLPHLVSGKNARRLVRDMLAGETSP